MWKFNFCVKADVFDDENLRIPNPRLEKTEKTVPDDASSTSSRVSDETLCEGHSDTVTLACDADWNRLFASLATDLKRAQAIRHLEIHSTPHLSILKAIAILLDPKHPKVNLLPNLQTIKIAHVRGEKGPMLVTFALLLSAKSVCFRKDPRDGVDDIDVFNRILNSITGVETLSLHGLTWKEIYAISIPTAKNTEVYLTRDNKRAPRPPGYPRDRDFKIHAASTAARQVFDRRDANGKRLCRGHWMIYGLSSVLDGSRHTHGTASLEFFAKCFNTFLQRYDQVHSEVPGEFAGFICRVGVASKGTCDLCGSA